jgi:secreted trypsin-like serine protease
MLWRSTALSLVATLGGGAFASAVGARMHPSTGARHAAKALSHHNRPPAAHAAVVGGSPASSALFASVAFVSDRRQEERFSCTGTVIAPTVILTAGHCAENDTTAAVASAAGFSVATHSVNLTGADIEQSAVSRVFVDPGFHPWSSRDDAALLILATPTTAPAVAVAGVGATAVPAGTRAVMAGWGRTSYYQHRTSTLLRSANTVVQSDPWCSRHLRAFDPGSEICTIDPPRYLTAPCYGDSGGPLLTAGKSRPLEIGIMSDANSRCSPSGPAVFTGVNAISAWLTRVVGSVARSYWNASSSRLPKLRRR